MLFVPRGISEAIFVLCLLSCTVSFAKRAKKVRPTFGAEFTFTNRVLAKGDYGKEGEIICSDENIAAQKAMKDTLSQMCRQRKNCHIEKDLDRYGVELYRVKYNDGWYFELTLDPGVVEVTTKPATLKEFEKMRSRIQEDIFDVAKQNHLFPWTNNQDSGGGHIHIGADIFEKNPELFRNFIADFANHSEIAWGGLLYSADTAAPLAKLPSQKRKNFAAFLKQFDEGHISDAAKLAQKIEKEVYGPPLSRGDEPHKNQALNMHRMVNPKVPPKQRTLEVRSIRSQRSAKEFLKEIRLFQARLNYLNRLDKPVVYTNSPIPKVAKRARNFRRYVVEAGLEWDDIKSILLPSWQKYAESKGSCAKTLSRVASE